jgi:hypothetical protein
VGEGIWILVSPQSQFLFPLLDYSVYIFLSVSTAFFIYFSAFLPPPSAGLHVEMRQMLIVLSCKATLFSAFCFVLFVYGLFVCFCVVNGDQTQGLVYIKQGLSH